MNDILLVTVPATLVLVATLGARFVEHYLQGKRDTQKQKQEKERETREAKRRHRESIGLPIRETLTEIQTKLTLRSMWEFVKKEKEQSSWSPDQASMEKFREVIVQSEDADIVETMTKRLPLVYQISNQETRKFLELLIFGFAMMTQEDKDKLTMDYWNEQFSSAYQKLENFVTLAD